MRRFAVALATLVVLGAPAAIAQHLRWSSQADATSLDPHYAIEPVMNTLNSMVYERLVSRAADMSIMPSLAVTWRNTAPRTWVFHLRQGVRFHDGTPFTADDVVFSFGRARFSGGTFNVFAQAAGDVRRIDDHTIEFTTPVPNPRLVDVVYAIPIMSAAWCRKNNAVRPANLREKDEGRATYDAMGTGPFLLVAREAGVKTSHRRNPAWWGLGQGLYTGNLETVEHRPIASGATRTLALKSGAIDFVWDPAVQDIASLREDPGIRLWQVGEQRLVFLGFDQHRDELLHSDMKSRNPFKDRRVRLALYQAIDVEAIRSQIMRSQATPTAIPAYSVSGLGPPVMDQRHRFDPARARQLLTEAGYPDGFGFRFTCTTDRFLNDERLCTAIAAMWAKIGLQVHVEAIPRAVFAQKAYARDVTAFLMSFGGANPDQFPMLRTVFRSPGADGAGDMNFGNARIPELDALVDRIEVEMNDAARQELLNRALRLVQDEIQVIPLHRQVITWAARRHVSTVPRPDNFLDLKRVTLH